MKYTFKYDGVLSILKDGKPVLENVSVSTRVNAEEEIRYALSFVKNDDTTASFENTERGFSVTLTLSEQLGAMVLRTKATYVSGKLEYRYGAHFYNEDAISVNFARVSDAECFTANWLGCEFWCRTAFANKPEDLPKEKIQGLLCKKNDGEIFYALPVCDKVFKSLLRAGLNGGLDLYMWSNDNRNSCDTIALVMDFGENAYDLVPATTKKAFTILGKKDNMRQDRRYPEIFEYLGWCSWDAFHMDVTHDDLIAKAKEFKDKDIPVRWAIIDDMWGDVPSINRPTMHSRELTQFEADPVRFPNGLKAVIQELKNDYGIITGMWHPTTGYWNGINPDGKIAKEMKDLLVYTDNKKLVHSPELAKAFEYYNTQHKFYRDCGAEFVKVDNQSFIRQHYKFLTSVGEAAANLHNAIEASVGVHFDGALINCMCMANENFWNRPTSAVCRFSNDFHPENRKWFVQHLLQCSYNCLFQGCVYYGDWDMWWSDDAQGKKNAVLRAMSGGPVYVSDELNRSVKETLMPIVYRDGRIIRLDQLCTVTPDCLMSNPETNRKIFKVFNRVGNYGVLAVFNMDKDERIVRGEVSPADMGLEGDYVCYDWFNKKIIKAEHKLQLKNYDDFRLYIFLPVKDGKAFIGLTEKYMSAKTIDYIAGGDWRVNEAGKLGIYSKNALNFIKVDGVKTPVTKVDTCLYEVEITKDNAVVSF